MSFWGKKRRTTDFYFKCGESIPILLISPPRLCFFFFCQPLGMKSFFEFFLEVTSPFNGFTHNMRKHMICLDFETQGRHHFKSVTAIPFEFVLNKLWKLYRLWRRLYAKKGIFEPGISCVRNQHSTSAPGRDRQQREDFKDSVTFQILRFRWIYWISLLFLAKLKWPHKRGRKSPTYYLKTLLTLTSVRLVTEWAVDVPPDLSFDEIARWVLS